MDILKTYHALNSLIVTNMDSFRQNGEDMVAFSVDTKAAVRRGESVGYKQICMTETAFFQAITEYCEFEKAFVYGSTGKEILLGEIDDINDVIGIADAAKDLRYRKAFTKMLIGSGHIVRVQYGVGECDGEQRADSDQCRIEGNW